MDKATYVATEYEDLFISNVVILSLLLQKTCLILNTK